MPGEFQIIREHFQREAGVDDLVLGIGDDGAVLRPRPGFDQVVVTDTLVEGRHFPAGFPPEDIGWRALAVNLSDIAAMGAVPRFAFLNLTLRGPDDTWLHRFAGGFFELAARAGVALAGGDTTEGPLSVTVTVIGEVITGGAVRRDGARPGDLVCISGRPGEAAAGLEILQSNGSGDVLIRRFRRPEPRLQLGGKLPGLASAAIDVSDGLLADLDHVMTASGTGAKLELASLPVSDALRDHAGEHAADYVLAGGDDYELCFCVPAGQRDTVAALAEQPVTIIGEVVAGTGVEVIAPDGRPYVSGRRGFEHFRGMQA